MKVWRYKEMKKKVLSDLDLEDETFISPPELAGYFNDATDDAESEIQGLTLSPDYFLKNQPLAVVQAQNTLSLPNDIYANKIRAVIYSNGAIIYPLTRFKPLYQFTDLAFSQQYGQADDYRYLLVNSQPGQIRMQISPAARETAIVPPPLPYPETFVPPQAFFTPVTVWYIRTVQRLPMPTYQNVQGELLPRESLVPASIDFAADTLTTICGSLRPSDGITPYVAGGLFYKFGDIVYFTTTGTLPSPLVVNTPYYVIETATPGVIKLATSQQNAVAGTAIDLLDAGTGYFQLSVVTTATILDELYVDIPQFPNFVMSYVKKMCVGKESDPRYADINAELERQRAQMVASLGKMIPDLDDEIQPDLSAYTEMS